MGMLALSRRDKMRRAEIKDLKKKVSKLRSLLRKREAEIESLKREMEVFGGGDIGLDSFFAAIY
ncbi:MAG: hypothetical protein E3J47_08120 [Candidatus Stahlbacteria bacterium]|nr:MAG: hypothetical protein E3J47_08120 [Candidatus Stahlbacteria bacterium]